MISTFSWVSGSRSFLAGLRQTASAILGAWTVEIVTSRQEVRAEGALGRLPARSPSSIPAAARYGFIAFMAVAVFVSATLALY